MEVVYPCSMCTKAYKTKQKFLFHMKTVHQYNSPLKYNDKHKNIFACSQCYKEFSSKLLLNKHVHIKHNNLKHSTEDTSMKKSNEFHERSTYNCLPLKDLVPPKYNYDQNCDKAISSNLMDDYAELNSSNILDQNEETSVENNEFENVLSELQYVNTFVRNQFIMDPYYFKDGMQLFVSFLEKSVTSDASLFLACHSENSYNL